MRFLSGLILMGLNLLPFHFICQICPYPAITAELTTLIWAEEISWSIIDEDGITVAGPFSGFLDNSTYTEIICLEPGCYTALLEDSYGDGWHDGYIKFATQELGVFASGTVNSYSNSVDIFTSPQCGTISCEPGTGSPYYASLTEDLYGEEISWGILNETNDTLVGPFSGYHNNTAYTESFCLTPDCYTVWMHDSYGDGWQGGELTIADSVGSIVFSGLVPNPPGDTQSSPLSLTEGCPIPGCMNPAAFNYNPEANVDDGNCMRQSDNVSLYSSWTDNTLPITGFNGSFNDVEGLLMNGGEYAIIGSTLGTHIIDVSQPESSLEVHFLPGADGGSFVTHRDYHIDGNLLFAVCDQGSSSLQIFDLSNLPGAVTTLYDSNEFCITAHNVFVDNDSDLLYLCSTSSPSTYTPIRVLDVSNPTSPTEFIDLSPWVSYCHDIYVENDTAWVNSGGAGLFVLHIDSTPTIIGTLTDYPFQGGNHSGWWIPENNVYVLADETHGSPLKVIDTSDMTDLQVVSTLSSGVDPQSIPHNLMVRDGLVFVSYYHDGLQVFDISDPASPNLIAWFDTFIETSHAGFAGAWGVHSALPSGRILISDITNGLFVLEVVAEQMEVCPTELTEWNGLIIDSNGYYSVELPDNTWGMDIALMNATLNMDVCPECPGDFDQNGTLGVGDLQIILAAMGCTNSCEIDLNGDDSTTVSDILLWLSSFGTVCD